MSEGNLLVVDDELFVRELLQEYFTKLSYNVDIAKDGVDALTAVRRNTYQAVLLDLKMPGMDGVELLKAIKEIDREPHVILMTGYPTVESAVSALRRHAYDYIIKPFRLNELESIVCAAVKDCRAERDLRQMTEKVRRLEQALEDTQPWQPVAAPAGGRSRFKLEEMPAPLGEHWASPPRVRRPAEPHDVPVG